MMLRKELDGTAFSLQRSDAKLLKLAEIAQNLQYQADEKHMQVNEYMNKYHEIQAAKKLADKKIEELLDATGQTQD